MTPGRPGRRLLLLGFAEAILLAALGWVPGARATPFPALLLWSTAFLAYAAAGWAQASRPVSEAVVWGVGIGMRLALLPLLPHYSDDIYRFLWDGWVQVNGFNPFTYAPSDPALATLRTPWHGLINHPEISTIYPPAAQLVFRMLASVEPSVLLFKSAWVACDLGIAWAVARLAAARRSTPGASPALLLYLWSPLAVLEIAWSGHLEPLALLPVLAALLLARSPRHVPAAGALLGLGAGVKFAPAVGLPVLARRGVPLAAGLGLLTFGLLYLPYLDAGARLWAGLRAYAARWEFNPGAFRLLEVLLGAGRPPRLAAAALVGGAALLALGRRWSLERTLFWVLGSTLLLTPTLHPWYLLWILPFAALRRSRGWLLLGGLVFFAYGGRDIYHATGSWPQPGWLAAFIYLPPLLVLAHDGLRSRAARTLGSSPRSRRRTGQ